MHLSTALAFALFAAHDGSVHSCGSLNARRAQTTHLQAPALGDTAHPGAFQCNRWSQPPRPQRREHCSEASALPRPHPRCWWHRRAPRETRQTAGDLGAFLRSECHLPPLPRPPQHARKHKQIGPCLPHTGPSPELRARERSTPAACSRASANSACGCSCRQPRPACCAPKWPLGSSTSSSTAGSTRTGAAAAGRAVRIC
mmetsp:Transcript_104790/g.301271  ORF Transcript_104790/g.301271 Transcript_104790/m.301271 type:complete len:200 (-) Transcript_104790:167-766(-)